MHQSRTSEHPSCEGCDEVSRETGPDTEQGNHADHDSQCDELGLADIMDVLQVNPVGGVTEQGPLHGPQVVTCGEHHGQHTECEQRYVPDVLE